LTALSGEDDAFRRERFAETMRALRDHHREDTDRLRQSIADRIDDTAERHPALKDIAHAESTVPGSSHRAHPV